MIILQEKAYIWIEDLSREVCSAKPLFGDVASRVCSKGLNSPILREFLSVKCPVPLIAITLASAPSLKADKIFFRGVYDTIRI